MKFDIVRAWKDEAYRLSLSNEQISTLPANPAGELELSTSELESVNGGSLGSGNSFAEDRRFHSLAFRCNENAFSITTVHGFNFLSPIVPICINKEEERKNDSEPTI